MRNGRRLGIGGLAGLVALGAVSATGEALAEPFHEFDCAARRQDELTCLACNIYHEARDQPEQGQLAVAMVTLNRLRTADFPKSICEVVWEKGRDHRTGRTVAQFSWTLDDRPDRVTEPAAWEKAKALASRALATLAPSGAPPGAPPGAAAGPMSIPDPSIGALYFHADSVTPDWSADRGLRLVTRIGNHLFYARTKETPGLSLASASVAAPRILAGPVDAAAPLDPELARHPALGAVRRGAKLISLSRDGAGGLAEAKVYQGTRSWVVRIRREGL